MTAEDNSDLEFAYHPGWFLSLSVLGSTGILSAISGYFSFLIFRGSRLPFGIDVEMHPVFLALVAAMAGFSFFYVAFLVLRNIARPRVIFINSQRICLPVGAFSTSYEKVFFSQIQSVIESSNGQVLEIHHKKGVSKIYVTLLGNQKDFQGLKNLLHRFIETAHKESGASLAA